MQGGDAAVGGFLQALGGRGSFADQGASSSGPSVTPTGDAPAPFDAQDGPRLAGPSGTHPLADLSAGDLLQRVTDGLEGSIEVAGPVRIGEGIRGTIRVRATRAIAAGSAGIRLVGVLLREEMRSGPTRQADASNAATQAAAIAAHAAASVAHLSPGGAGAPPLPVATDTSTVSWVEVHGQVVEDLRYAEPTLPTLMAPNQLVEIAFEIPAPCVGPPSAHAGSALIAWAVEAHWGIAMGADEWVATVVAVEQPADLLRSGVVALPADALSDVVIDDGASLSVSPVPPLVPGSAVTLNVAWPDAPGGRAARVELTTDVRAMNGLSVVSERVPVDRASLGGTQVTVPLPADLPPTVVTEGLSVGHRLRVIIDRKMRSDVAAERPIVVT